MIPFTKAEALGNDFVLLNAESVKSLICEENWASWIRHLSDRRLGIGCDQVIVGDASHLRFFNADGSEAELCINGIRAFMVSLYEESGLSQTEFFTQSGSITANMITPTQVEITLPAVRDIIPLPSDFGVSFFVNVGNPHRVVFSDQDLDVSFWGKRLESWTDEERVNVSFVKEVSFQTLYLKVWERGVGLTPCCGSAAYATALAHRARGFDGESIVIIQEGGPLTVSFSSTHPTLVGNARCVFKGNIPHLPHPVFLGRIYAVQKTGDDSIVDVDFGDQGFRQTRAMLTETPEALLGKTILGIFDDQGSFSLVGQSDNYGNFKLVFFQ